MGWRFPAPWVRRSRSIFSRPATARRRSPEISWRLPNEVNPLIKALRDNGIEVTAIHNHMLDDEPRAFFIHFWANDDAVKLAKGLRAALDAVHVAAKG